SCFRAPQEEDNIIINMGQRGGQRRSQLLPLLLNCGYGSKDDDYSCVACPAGKFSKGKYEICRRHKDCDSLYRATILTPGTLESDAECGPCLPGYYILENRPRNIYGMVCHSCQNAPRNIKECMQSTPPSSGRAPSVPSSSTTIFPHAEKACCSGQIIKTVEAQTNKQEEKKEVQETVVIFAEKDEFDKLKPSSPKTVKSIQTLNACTVAVRTTRHQRTSTASTVTEEAALGQTGSADLCLLSKTCSTNTISNINTSSSCSRATGVNTTHTYIYRGVKNAGKPYLNSQQKKKDPGFVRKSLQCCRGLSPTEAFRSTVWSAAVRDAQHHYSTDKAELRNVGTRRELGLKRDEIGAWTDCMQLFDRSVQRDIDPD
ncbi:hypothetical protein cypCar_00036399, partial [Cyprinus carpio]